MGYSIPTGNDTDNDGVDNAYDAMMGWAAPGLTPVNTDGTDLPDYRDTDSDNDTKLDRTEAGFTNPIIGADNDNDGMDNSTDVVSGIGTVSNVTNNLTVASIPNVNLPGTPEKDYREAGADNDLDGIDDSLDQCPNTAMGATVNSDGCTDMDGDGYFPDALSTSPNFDPADNNACIPDTSAAACILVDDDMDGYYENVSNTNTKFDPDDTHPCVPDNTVAACDSDGDGVADGNDLCPGSPSGASSMIGFNGTIGCLDKDGDGYYVDAGSSLVDSLDPDDTMPCIPNNLVAACDTDMDGVPDGRDACPFSAPGAVVNQFGCTDVDGDGYFPDLPVGAQGYDPNDNEACIPEPSEVLCIPIDNDGDGYYENYPTTHPQYDSVGTNPCIPDNTVAACDEDNDGIADGLDLCQGSPAMATVNSDGCEDADGDGFFPFDDSNRMGYDPNDAAPCIPSQTVAVCDTDMDGISDGNDQCPNTVQGATINSAGCTDFDGDGYYPDAISTSPNFDLDDTQVCIPNPNIAACDDDGDGVPNGNDHCPNSPVGANLVSWFITTIGCLDQDNDGYYPDTLAGAAFDPNDGNPCIPDTSVSNCNLVDLDGDGYFKNLASNHPNYDPDDNDACIPDMNNIHCDTDKDGVANITDTCPTTAVGATVNATGCTDADGDGFFPDAPTSSAAYDPNDNDICIPDAQDTDGDGYCDRRENQLTSDINDPCDPDPSSLACDTDNDGIVDANDQCPNSTSTFVTSFGCTDTDGDSYYPDAPVGSLTFDPDDTNACVPLPLATACMPDDTDGDGYYENYPATSTQFDPNDADPCIPNMSVTVCDTDDDGIVNAADQCPNSAPNATVNNSGCTDSDGDGFYPDAPSTSPNFDSDDTNACIPNNASLTCDNDQDGVLDIVDQCPNSSVGAVVNSHGCTDADQDGYYDDVASTSMFFDPDDTEPCIPQALTSTCVLDDSDGDAN
jgi:hypothetical protein